MGAGPGRPRGSRNRAPIGFAAYVRDSTLQGHELVDFYLAVLRGDKNVLAKPPRLRDQMQAADWLANRGFGRPSQTIEAGETLAQIWKDGLQRLNGGEPSD